MRPPTAAPLTSMSDLLAWRPGTRADDALCRANVPLLPRPGCQAGGFEGGGGGMGCASHHLPDACPHPPSHLRSPRRPAPAFPPAPASWPATTWREGTASTLPPTAGARPPAVRSTVRLPTLRHHTTPSRTGPGWTRSFTSPTPWSARLPRGGWTPPTRTACRCAVEGRRGRIGRRVRQHLQPRMHPPIPLLTISAVSGHIHFGARRRARSAGRCRAQRGISEGSGGRPGPCGGLVWV